jgi:hypothetical protein
VSFAIEHGDVRNPGILRMRWRITDPRFVYFSLAVRIPSALIVGSLLFCRISIFQSTGAIAKCDEMLICILTALALLFVNPFYEICRAKCSEIYRLIPAVGRDLFLSYFMFFVAAFVTQSQRDCPIVAALVAAAVFGIFIVEDQFLASDVQLLFPDRSEVGPGNDFGAIHEFAFYAFGIASGIAFVRSLTRPRKYQKPGLIYEGSASLLVTWSVIAHLVWRRWHFGMDRTALNELFQVPVFVLFVTLTEYGHMTTDMLSVPYQDLENELEDPELGVDSKSDDDDDQEWSDE